jgi:RNA polymerase sigma-70 factor (ECF subfamily)
VKRQPAEKVLKVLENGTDEQFLVAAAQRDPSRFAELYEANFERVYAFIARRVSSREDAQDLTAEVFHEALRNLSRFEWRGLPFAAWLLGIAAHLLADRWRRSAKHQEVSADDLEEPGADPQIEEHAMLFQLVNALAPDQRLVILRRFVDQKSLREIAQELRRSEGAVKQLQFRALQNLRIRMRSRYV